MNWRGDYIIVGQGLAGTTLAWQLLRREQRVLVVDRPSANSASRMAAGLVTPVTGKRLAKSWRWDELYPFARAFYREIEATTGATFFHAKPAIRILADAAEREEYLRRREGVLQGLVQPLREALPAGFHAPQGAFELATAARLDVPGYLDASQARFRAVGSYYSGSLDWQCDVEFSADGVRLPRYGFQAQRLVLCCGFAGDRDPWFSGIRFNAAKGELLTIRIPGFHHDRVTHHGVWLAPLQAETYLLGATYSWEPFTEGTTLTGRCELESRLRKFLQRPYTVVDHRAAIRPVIDAGFPALGRHPAIPQLAYFNGLGSKGSLLAPYFAAQLADLLGTGQEPEPKVDVRRFLPS